MHGQQNIKKIIKSVYYAYFHCIVKYRIMFWVNSSISGKIFTLQKKIVRIMAVAQPGTSCIILFTHVPCQYSLSLLNFIFHNQEIFQTNSFIHNINTSSKHHHHRPNASLSCFQKSTFCAGTKIFNALPPGLKTLNSDTATFKAAIRQYQRTHSTYSADHFYV